MTNSFVRLRPPLKCINVLESVVRFILPLWCLLLVPLFTLRYESKLDSDRTALQDKELNQQRAEAVLKEHGNAILRLAHSYLHNLADAEDMLQEALLQMLRKAPAFDSPDHQKAWLFRVTINLCKNKIKYNQRRRWEDWSESLTSEVREDLTFVWEAVSSLPVKYREVIHLFYQEDLSTAQIAKLLNKQDSTIRSLLHRARLILKEQLMEGYDFEE